MIKKVLKNKKLFTLFLSQFFKNKNSCFFIFLVPFIIMIIFGFSIKDKNIFKFTFPLIFSYSALSICTFNLYFLIICLSKKGMFKVFLSYKYRKIDIYFSLLLSLYLPFILIVILLSITSFIFIKVDFLYLLILILLSHFIFVFIFATTSGIYFLNKISFTLKHKIINIMYYVFLLIGGFTIPSYILMNKLGIFYDFLAYLSPITSFVKIVYWISTNSFKLTNISILITFLSFIFVPIITLIITFKIWKNNSIKSKKFQINKNNKIIDFIFKDVFYKKNKIILKGKNIISVKKNQKINISGNNGMGKTTLLNLIFFKLHKKEKISFIDERQDFCFLEKISNLRNFFESISSNSTNLSPIQNKIKRFEKKEFRELSDGQKQLFKFYIFILSNPKFLLLDEYLSYLDIKNKEIIEKILNNYIINNNVYVINVLHDYSLTVKMDYYLKERKIIKNVL